MGKIASFFEILLDTFKNLVNIVIGFLPLLPQTQFSIIDIENLTFFAILKKSVPET